MRILLTGGAGFVGSHCVEYWLRHWPASTVTVLDSLAHRGRRERLAHIDHGGRLNVVCADMGSGPPLRLLAGLGEPFDVIVNMASDSHVDRSIEMPEIVWMNNTRLMVSILKYAREVPPGMFIQISTDEVYGPARVGELHPEWDSIVPSNPYSASKAAQEALCISYWRTYGTPVTILNLMNMIGERQHPEKFLPKIVGKILRGEEVEIHGDPRTGQVGSRFYLHARNCADALMFLAQKSVPASFASGADDRPDRYNLAGDEEIDNLTLARLVAEVLDLPLHHRITDWSRPGHDLRYGLNGRKLAAMGWRPVEPLRAAIKRTVLWYRDNPSWLEST